MRHSDFTIGEGDAVRVPICSIRYAILQLADEQERNAKEAASYAISVTGADKCWMQVQLGTLNFGYPRHENPADFLAERGVTPLAGLTVSAFEPALYATLTYDPCSVEDLVRFLRDFVMVVYALPWEDGMVDIEPQILPGEPEGMSQHDWYLAMPSRWPRGASPQSSENPAQNHEATWREPLLNTDLWELASAEERSSRSDGSFAIPSMTDRTALKPGDLVLLLFQMLGDQPGETEMAEERMWVLITQITPAGRFLGRLINQPNWVDSRAHYLTEGSEVPFQIKHIAEIRRRVQRDIDDVLANTLHRKWE